MKIFTKTIFMLLVAIVITGQHSAMTITPADNNVHIMVDQISAPVTLTNLWQDAGGRIFREGILDLAPGRYDRYNGHTFYVPWEMGPGGEMQKFPATHVKITTDDGGDTGWMELPEL